MAATKRFSGFLIVPVLFFNIKYSDKWLLSGSFPLKQKLSYYIDNKKQIGINLGTGNNSFRLSKAKENRYVNTQQFGAGYSGDIDPHSGILTPLKVLFQRTDVG